MRAGAWSANRDIAAARLSWERARRVADALPGDHPNRLAMRIAPRTLLCGSAWRRFHDDIAARFEELRELCAQAGDKASLAVGMAGMVIENMHHARIGEASRLASECMALVESLGDPTLIVELSFAALRRQASGRRVGRRAALVADRDRTGRPSPCQREHLGGLANGRRVGVPRCRSLAVGPWRVARGF